VTDTTNHVTEEQGTSLVARIGWAVLILATLYVCYFSHLGAIGFVGPDEPRYAWIARDMMETGDWITPRLYGKPWFEKPVLYYWGAALCFKLFGVSEAAARLPSAISALLATLALAWLALRLYGVETARWLLLLLPTTVGMIGFSHAAAPDMPFSGMLTIAMVAAAVVLGLVPQTTAPSSFVSLTSSTSLAAVLFGFSLGLAVLAKGPAAIILCGGTVFFWALFTKRWRETLRLLHPTPILAFCVTALPWYILCARRNPDFFHVFIIEHNFKRYLTPEFQHIQPFWYYGPVALAGVAPWTIQLLLKFCLPDSGLGKRRTSSSHLIFFGAWILFTVAFFSFSKSKLPGYILPLIPPLVLLLLPSSRSVLQSGRDRRFESFTIGLTATGFCLWLVGWAYFASSINQQIPEKLSQVAIPRDFIFFSKLLGYSGLLVLAVSGWRRRFKQLLIVTALLAVILVEGAGRMLLPWEDKIISTRGFSQSFAESTNPKITIYTYKLRRSAEYGLEYYLRKNLEEWNPAAPTPGYILYSQLAVADLRCSEVGLGPIQMEGFPDVGICLNQQNLPARTPDGGKPQ
jgi:4-amino-4-deoxy-L-arabinose transferase-like glycosyltransferase